MQTTTEITKIEATVTAFGRIQTSRYSNEQVQSVLFERWDRHDDSRKVWKTFSVPEARQFRKNQPVLLTPIWRNNCQSWSVERLEDSNDSYSSSHSTQSQYPEQPEPKRISPAAFGGSPGAIYPSSQSASVQVQTHSLSPGQTKEISTWLAHQADLYACCFSEAKRALSLQEPQEETVRACASSLFISANRKFRLEA